MLVSKYTDKLRCVPNAPTQEFPADAAGLRARCIQANLDLNYGGAAHTLPANYSEFFDVENHLGEDWRMNHDERFRICCDIAIAQQDAFYRLVHRLGVAKMSIRSS